MSRFIESYNSWMKPQSSQLSINSHTSIRNALEGLSVPQDFEIEIFLQGSYKNHTNIRGDSDVDIIVNLKGAFFDNLNEHERQLIGIINSDYSWYSFNALIIEALRARYGSSSVNVNNKAIEITFGSNNYVSADVVVTFNYRKYTSISEYTEGIAFLNRGTKELVINFPKQHYLNGNDKSSSTNGLYRNYVRLLKNSRNKIIKERIPPSFDAPSYFIESIVYNLDNSVIKQSPDDFLKSAINIWEYEDQQNLLCQNEITPLFGYKDTCWNHYDKVQFSAALRNLLGW